MYKNQILKISEWNKANQTTCLQCEPSCTFISMSECSAKETARKKKMNNA